MKSEIIENIKQAFLQLEFSSKLLTYTELGNINKKEFDTDLTIRDVSFLHSSFDSYDDLIHGAHNTFNITLGFTSIVLNSSLELVGIAPNPNDRTPDGMLRTLIYMSRCAYAHDLMHPKWEVRGANAQALEIKLKNRVIKLDLTKKHGAVFDIKDIGGLNNYFEIKDMICKWIQIS